MLYRFVRAYQEVQPLTIGELWAIAITLRVVLVENLSRLAEQIMLNSAARQAADAQADRLLGARGRTAEPASVVLAEREGTTLRAAFAVQLVHRLRDQDPRITPALTWLDQHLAAQGMTADAVVRDEHQRQGAATVTVRNIITSMRLISDVDWSELLERISLVDDTLSASSLFHDMDFPTRNLHRSANEELARGANRTELEVAHAAVLAVKLTTCVHPSVEEDRISDPGHHLLGDGRQAFETAIGFQPPLKAARSNALASRCLSTRSSTAPRESAITVQKVQLSPFELKDQLIALASWPKRQHFREVAMTRMLACFTVGTVFVFASQLAQAAPPVANIEPFVADNYGTLVTDNYRWMETPDSKPLAKFMKGQDDYARSMLDSLPGRAKLLSDISTASNQISLTEALIIAAGKYFYRQTEPGQNTAKVYMRDSVTGKRTLLIDPNKFGPNGTPEAVNFFQPSQDGRYLAYGISANDSEAATLHVIETTTLQDQGVAIDRVQGENGTFLPVWWLPDHQFAYYRMRKLTPVEPTSNFFLRSRGWLHRLGKNPDGDGDTPIFGYGVDKAVPVAPDEDALVKVLPGSNYAFGVLTRNESNNVIDAIFATPLVALEAGNPIWKRVVSSDDSVTAFDAVGDDLFLLTYREASQYKIVAMNLAAPGVADSQIVVPQSSAVIRGFVVSKDALYVNGSLNGISQITRLPLSNGIVGIPERLDLPYAGTANALVANETEAGAVFSLESWTHSALWYEYDPVNRRIDDTGLQKSISADTSGLVSKEVSAVSYDGTMVPLSIIMKAGTRLDGKNPTILIGYGSYGVTLTPSFDASSLPWFDRGGITAIAHVRGGGWYGEEWHSSGMKLTKINTIFDFVACAQYLVDHHFTSPRYLAGKGDSAGGIAIGGAITWRPDLFAAAIDSHGDTDALRMQFTPNGPPNIEEFGSVTTSEGFHGLYAMSAYEHIRDRVSYPAVLLETGTHDPRVAPWIVAKMAARLQSATSSARPILLRVSYDSGHGVAPTKAQNDSTMADEISFILWQTGVKGFQPKQNPGHGN